MYNSIVVIYTLYGLVFNLSECSLYIDKGIYKKTTKPDDKYYSSTIAAVYLYLKQEKTISTNVAISTTHLKMNGLQKQN